MYHLYFKKRSKISLLRGVAIPKDHKSPSNKTFLRAMLLCYLKSAHSHLSNFDCVRVVITLNKVLGRSMTDNRFSHRKTPPTHLV